MWADLLAVAEQESASNLSRASWPRKLSRSAMARKHRATCVGPDRWVLLFSETDRDDMSIRLTEGQ